MEKIKHKEEVYKNCYFYSNAQNAKKDLTVAITKNYSLKFENDKYAHYNIQIKRNNKDKIKYIKIKDIKEIDDNLQEIDYYKFYPVKDCKKIQ
ncbi:MAG: hypothetical protein ACQEQE_11200 [Bacillota bacterium]